MSLKQRLLSASSYLYNSETPWVFPTFEFTWQSNGDTNGLIYWMGSNHGNVTFDSPARIGGATFDASSAYGTDYGPWRAVDRGAETRPWYTSNTTGHWWKMDLGFFRKFVVSDYTVYRTSNGADGSVQMQSWQLQGSNDGTNWTTIDTVASAGLSSEKTYAKFSPNSVDSYQMLRIYTPTSGHQCIGDIEFYGILTDYWPESVETYRFAGPPSTMHMGAPFYSGLNWVVGTWFEETTWSNPLSTRALPLKASRYDQNYDVDKTANRTTDANGWHTYLPGGTYDGLNTLWTWDLRNLVSFIPKMLAIKTRYEGSSWPNGKLQGSLNGTDWSDICSWTNHNLTYAMDGVWTFLGFDNSTAYPFIRMISTDSGTAKSLQEVELLGDYKSLIPQNVLGPNAQNRGLHRVTGYNKTTLAPNAGGILDYLGKNYGIEAWQNPHTRGLVTVSASNNWSGYDPHLICDHSYNYWHSANTAADNWVKFDFGADWRIQPTAFMFINDYYLGDVYLEASNDNSTWTPLYNLSTLDKNVQQFHIGSIYYTGCQNGYRYLRLIDKNAVDYKRWAEVEFWGYFGGAPD